MAEKLVVRKIIAAPPHDVFEAWTDPEGMRLWMCPGDTRDSRARLDVRIGGSFEIVMKGAKRDTVHSGVYRVVEPPRKLAFTWISDGTDDTTTLVTVEFLERGSGTEVVLTHEGLPDARLETHRGGWGTILELLGRRLELHRL